MNTLQLLDRVHKWHDAWHTLRWTGRCTLTSPRRWGRHDGYSNEKLWVNGSVVSLRSVDNRGITFSLIPSLLRGISAKTWTMEDAGFLILGFAHDYSRDLLILVDRS